MRAVAAGPRPPLTLRLVDWADEEGARFGRPGGLERRRRPRPRSLRGLRDRDGVALPDALAARGVELDRMLEAGAELDGVAAYLELHIEQGPVLESIDPPLGVVSGVFGLQRHRVVVPRRPRPRRVHADGPAPRRLPRPPPAALWPPARAPSGGRTRAPPPAPSRSRRASSPRSTGSASSPSTSGRSTPGVVAEMVDEAREASQRIAAEEGSRSSGPPVRPGAGRSSRRSWSRSPPASSRTSRARRRPACRAAPARRRGDGARGAVGDGVRRAASAG